WPSSEKRPGGRDAELTVVSSEAPPNNLPGLLTSFIARDRELGHLQQMLSDHHIVTLVGPGGVGKSRLAVELAYRTLRMHPDGTWIVELAGLSDPELVPQALAATLHIPEGPLQPLVDALCHTLRDSEALVILDNCEHLIEACALLAGRIARACPRVRILATSQEPLRISGEALLPLAPLTVPGPDERDPRRIRNSESARLFAERARAVQPDFELSDDAVLSVAEICRQLNGVPLAVELASARIRSMSLADIAAGLDQRFRLLSTGDRTAPPRHQTLRAMMEWSTAQLDDTQQAVLRRLSVFSGGWTPEAAAFVCSDDRLTPEQALQAMGALVERSLVVLDHWRDQPRYRLLETVRAYGLEQLQAAREDRRLRLRHQDWYLTLLEHAEDETLEDELGWLRRMDQELDNVRAAIDFCLTVPATAERAAYASYGFWQYTDSRGCVPEMIRRFTALLALLPEGQHSRGWHLCQTLLCHGLGSQGRVDDAVPLFEAVLRFAHEIDDPWALFWSRAIHIQWMLYQKDPLGITLTRDALTHTPFQSFGLSPAYFQWFLGDALLIANEFDQGETMLRVAEEGMRHVRLRAFIARSLGIVAYQRGDLVEAERRLRESLERFMPFQDLRGFAVGIEELACVAAAREQYARAAALLGASAMLFDRISTSSIPYWQMGPEAAAEACRAELGSEDFQRRWSAGQSMTVERAVNYALRDDDQVPPEPGSSWARLTHRETETALLVAQGMTNREIAAVQVVTVKTVETHVSRVFGKLGLRTRAQLAAWVTLSSGGDPSAPPGLRGPS
ncbi:MAG: ATP-binding protein, partial [Chloroflexota bacterium]